MKKYPGFHRAQLQAYKTSTVVAWGHRVCIECFKQKPAAAFEKGYLCKSCSPRARYRARTLKQAGEWAEES